MNEATRLANLALEKRGYVVVCHNDGPLPIPEPGKLMRNDINSSDGILRGPLLVTAETDYADWAEQMRTIGRKPGVGRIGERYFRLVAE